MVFGLIELLLVVHFLTESEPALHLLHKLMMVLHVDITVRSLIVHHFFLLVLAVVHIELAAFLYDQLHNVHVLLHCPLLLLIDRNELHTYESIDEIERAHR